MHPSRRDTSATHLGAPLRRQSIFLDLFRTATTQMLIRTAAAVVVAWVPLLILSAYRGGAALWPFLKDYANSSRFFIVLPVLILAERPLRDRLLMVAHQFETHIVPADQQEQFRANWTYHEKIRSTWALHVALILLTYATAVWLSQFLNPKGSEFLPWFTGGGGFRSLSPAGTWAFFVSYPILVYYTYLWIWRQLLWTQFLRSTAQLNLRLVAAHPDHLGGLGFLEASMLGQIPFSFCLGVGLAGGVANRIFNEGYPLLAFRYLAPLLIAGVLLACVAPYFVFTRTLMQMRRRGMSEYGAFAHAVGEQFEMKWLPQRNAVDESVLKVTDFTVTANLYALVGNIEEIRILPVGAVDVYAVVAAALIPAMPVVIGSIPFNDLMRAAMKLLF